MADVSWVTARLAVGSEIGSLFDARKIAALGVTRVMNLRAGENKPEHITDEAPWWAQAGVGYVVNPMDEDDGKGEVDWFKAGIDYAMESFKGTGKLFLHCNEGLHRSPSMAYAVLLALGIDKKTADKMVIEARPKAELKYAKDAEKAVKKLGYA